MTASGVSRSSTLRLETPTRALGRLVRRVLVAVVDDPASVMRFMSFASYVDTIKIDQKLIQNSDRRGANC